VLACPPDVAYGTIGNPFAAGFLLSAGVVHLLPEASSAFKDIYPLIEYPIASALAVAGACVTLSIDNMLRRKLAATGSMAESAHHSARSPSIAARLESTECGLNTPPRQCAGMDELRSCDRNASSNEFGTMPSRASDNDRSDIGEEAPLVEDSRKYDAQDGYIHDTCSGESAKVQGRERRRDPRPMFGVHYHDSAIVSGVGLSKGGFFGYVLAAALSFHSLMEGMALGASRPSQSQFLALLAAILTHKFFAAFALGNSLSIAASTIQGKKPAMSAAVGFALTTPIGAIFGMALSSSILPQAGRVVSAGLSSVSAGIFLYIALVELVAEDLRCEGMRHSEEVDPDNNDALLRTAIFVAAATVMSLLALVL
jgi:zinc transporter ZupT